MSKFTQKLEEFNVIAFDTRREVIGPKAARTIENLVWGQVRYIIGQVTVYAEKESGEALEHVDNIHWVYGRKISEKNITKD